jgi:hypothetical protein
VIRLLLIPFFSLCFGTVQAQVSDTLRVVSDSLRVAEPDSAVSKISAKSDSTKFLKRLRPRLTYAINWDTRSSIIQSKPINIGGFNAGIEFGEKRHELTFGYYWMTTNSYLSLIDLRRTNSKLINLDFFTKTNLYFFSVMYWPNLINNRKWRLTLPVEIGLGNSRNQNTTTLEQLAVWNWKSFFLPIQVGISGEWKATRWFGVSAAFGYRHSLASRGITDYNAPYYSYGIPIYPEFFKDVYHAVIKPKKKKDS